MGLIRDTVFAEYLEKNLGAKILETEFGFIFYKIIGQECYIVDLGVSEKSRKQGNCASMISDLLQKAFDAGCTMLTGKINLSSEKANETLAVSLKLGFKVVRTGESFLVIAKEIHGGSNG